MTDIDTSIYKTAAPPPINPLQMYGQVVGIQNAQGQNRLLQQQQDLRAGMGQAFAGAVDPTTGKVDQNRLLATVAHDPRTAWNFGDVNQQTQANVQATAQAQAAQLETAQKHLVAANGILSGYLDDKRLGVEDLSKEIAKGAIDLLTHGDTMNNTSDAVKMIQAIPKDPAAQKAYVIQHLNQNLALQGKVGDILGQPQFTSIGDQIVQTRTPTAGGPMVQTGSMSTTLSPGEKVQGQNTVAPNGQAGTVPVGTRFNRFGNLGGGAAPAAPAAAPAATPPLGRVNALTAQAAPSGAAPAPAAAPSGVPAGFLPTAQAPGVPESQGADVAKYKNDQALVPTRATNVQSLQKAKTALEALSLEFGGSGKGTDTLNHIRSVITSLTGAADASTMNWDEAKKYLLDYAKSQGAAAHSDQQLNAALGANASTEISNKAALDVVKTNIGRERQAIAQVQEQQNQTGIGYGDHASKFATKTDPRAFAWDQYTPEERTKILSGLKGDALKKFKDSLVIADRHGLIQKPQ